MYATTGIFRSASQINEAMGRVFGHMGLAVVTSMIVSMLVAGSPGLMALLFGTALKWVVIFAPLVAILALSFGLEKLTKTQATVALHGFAALMGVSFATIFHTFTGISIISAFMGGAVLFGTMAFYGYFTKRDLSGFGQFLFIGLIAIVIASIINIIFIGGESAVFNSVISALAIIIFTGLTAYDTQNIRQMVSVDNPGNLEIAGALSLYLNFINIFLSLLQLFGQKND
jgi:FtsH-binding integral membrane protein